MDRKIAIVVFALILALSVFFVHAAHTITPTTVNGVEDVTKLYNITVNNTDSGQAANITQINITLPNSFIFTATTNGSTSGGFSFSNTSTILSWSNLTGGYVLNGTEVGRFWFNLTAATPGIYNLTVTTLNATGARSSNITVTINDTTAPVIYLISPSNATSSTTSAYNFTFNVTDASSISSCLLIVDGSTIHSLSTVNNTGGNSGMYNSSFSVATHTWSVNCTDSASNMGSTSNFTFTVEATSAEETSTTTDSTSSGTGSPTYRPTAEKLSQGYRVSLGKNYKMQFKVEDSTHTLSINQVGGDSVTLTVASTPQQATLAKGESKDFDVSNDGFSDLRVTLVGINNGKADLIFQSIHEESTVATAPVEDSEDLEGDSAQNVEGASEESQSRATTWIILVVVVVIVVALIVALSRRKPRKKK